MYQRRCEKNGAGRTHIMSIDWRTLHKVTNVKQQTCGNCWALATAATLESSILIRENWNYNIGVPEYNQLCCNPKTLNDCCGCSVRPGDWCSGGFPLCAMNYCKSGGLHQRTTSNGNWMDVRPSCGDMAYQMKDYYMIATDPVSIKSALHIGPCLFSMYVYDDFHDYCSGVYDWDGVSPFSGCHAMLIVGYSEAEQCFIVKNSWGTGWGEAGYVRIAYNYFGGDRIDHVALPVQGSYSVSCLANGSHNLYVGASDIVTIIGSVTSDHVSDPVNYYIVAVDPGGAVYYLTASGWVTIPTPYRVEEIENCNLTIHSGTLSSGVWRVYVHLNHDVYHIVNSPYREDYCTITVG